MKRWNGHDHVENKRIDDFLNEVIVVCKNHGLSISHEDGHGAFVICDYDDSDSRWLMDALDKTSK